MPKRGKRRDGRIQNRKEARLDPQDDNGAPSKTIKENSSNIQGNANKRLVKKLEEVLVRNANICAGDISGAELILNKLILEAPSFKITISAGRRVMDMSRDENTPSEWASVLRGHRSVEDNALGSTSADLTNCRDDFNKSGRKKYPLKRGRPAKKGRKFIEHRSKTTQMSEQ
ncbi:hypothetical protein SK128_019255 [Halocaridina rubra]|uniref:Uncharacterized protein n=1 Tax=Halocaridina rubra TaxID=373956 RepID=A0AAN9AC30_HALRR